MSQDIRGDYPFLRICIVLGSWVTWIIKDIDIVSQSCESDSPFFIKSIDTRTDQIPFVSNIPRVFLKLPLSSAGFGSDIDRFESFTIVKTTQLWLFTFLVKNLNALDDFRRKVLQRSRKDCWERY